MTVFDHAINHNRHLVAAGAAGLILLALWHLFSPHGLIAYCRTSNQLEAIRAENQRQERTSQELITEIARLGNDDAYFSDIARQRGYLDRNEMIFDFTRPVR